MLGCPSTILEVNKYEPNRRQRRLSGQLVAPRELRKQMSECVVVRGDEAGWPLEGWPYASRPQCPAKAVRQ